MVFMQFGNTASHIRRLISEGEDYSAYVPKTLEGEPYLIKNSDKALLMKITAFAHFCPLFQKIN